MCDFRIREFGHPNYSHRYSIQCVLPMNLYNQQIFTFLWFWFIILIFVNTYVLCLWIYRLVPKQRRIYIKKRLKLLNKYQKLLYNRHDPTLRQSIKSTLKDFNEIYLKWDGVFIIRIISLLASDVVGTQVLHELWARRDVSNRSVCEHAGGDKKQVSETKKQDFNENDDGNADKEKSLNKANNNNSTYKNQPSFIKHENYGFKQDIQQQQQQQNDENFLNKPHSYYVNTENMIQPSIALSLTRRIRHSPSEQVQQSVISTSEKPFNVQIQSASLNKPKKVVAFAPIHQTYSKESQDDSQAYNHKSNYPYIDETKRDSIS